MRNKLLVALVISLFLICGCTNNKEIVEVNGEKVNTSKMGHKHCTRKATAGSGIDVSLSYDIYYTGNILNMIQSEEKIMSANSESLDTYEEAYRGIHEHYKDLEYYDTSLVRTETTVTSTMTIDYDKIDVEKLIEIEGSSSIFENNVAQLDKWLELAKKVGTNCEEVE